MEKVIKYSDLLQMYDREGNFLVAMLSWKVNETSKLSIIGCLMSKSFGKY